jgi:hypothetical protein
VAVRVEGGGGGQARVEELGCTPSTAIRVHGSLASKRVRPPLEQDPMHCCAKEPMP